MAKILVTGGLGFIGHRVVALLEATGHACVITDIQTTYGIVAQDELAWLIEQRRKTICTDRIHGVDIANREGVDWLMHKYQPDVVIHLASFPRQKVVNANPVAGSHVMMGGLLNLLEAAVKYQVKRFVYISSSMVYGNFAAHDLDGLDESHACRPLGQYGIMKLAGEWLVQDYQRRTGMDYTIVRPSAVYGPGDVEDRVVSKFLLAAMRGEEIRVNGANDELDFTYVDDVAQGIVQAAISEDSANNTYNITRGQARTLMQAAELAVAIAGRGSIRVEPRDNSFPSRGQLNTLRAQNDFGYCPEVNIEQGFREYYDWLENSFYRIKKAVQ